MDALHPCGAPGPKIVLRLKPTPGIPGPGLAGSSTRAANPGSAATADCGSRCGRSWRAACVCVRRQYPPGAATPPSAFPGSIPPPDLVHPRPANATSSQPANRSSQDPDVRVRPWRSGRAALPHHGVGIVEGQLLRVNIQAAYDGHWDLPKLPKGAQSAHTRVAYEPCVMRLNGEVSRGEAATGQPPQMLRAESRCMLSNW
jgi:hypothetical protein